MKTLLTLAALAATFVLSGCGPKEDAADNMATPTKSAVASTPPAPNASTSPGGTTGAGLTPDASNGEMQNVKPGEAGTR